MSRLREPRNITKALVRIGERHGRSVVIKDCQPNPWLIRVLIGRPALRREARIYEQLVSGELSDEKRDRYFDEIHRLFDKRHQTLDPETDARLSLTNSIGYCPHGACIPGWKAVFFNPRTDDQVIDRLVESIENLM